MSSQFCLEYLSTSVPGLSRWCCGKEYACSAEDARDVALIPGSGKIPWRRKWQPTPVFLTGKCYGQRSLADFSPWITKSDTTERTHTHTSFLSSVHLLGCVQLFATPWTATCQASLFIINSQSLLELMSMESVMSSNHLILCCPLLLSPSIFPSIRVFSKELVLHIRWPKYWTFSFSVSPSNEYSGL